MRAPQSPEKAQLAAFEKLKRETALYERLERETEKLRARDERLQQRLRAAAHAQPSAARVHSDSRPPSRLLKLTESARNSTPPPACALLHTLTVLCLGTNSLGLGLFASGGGSGRRVSPHRRDSTVSDSAALPTSPKRLPTFPATGTPRTPAAATRSGKKTHSVVIAEPLRAP